MAQYPFRHFSTLIKAVRELNPEAAEYLRGPAKELPSFLEDGDLDFCFTWSTTPQCEDDDDFWYELNCDLCDINWDHLVDEPECYVNGLPIP